MKISAMELNIVIYKNAKVTKTWNGNFNVNKKCHLFLLIMKKFTFINLNYFTFSNLKDF